MSQPFGDPRDECYLCGRPAVEDVDATNIDGDLIHDECLAMEEATDLPFAMPGPAALFVLAARGLRSPWEN